MNVFFKYLKDLCSSWIVITFFVIDVIVYCVGLFLPDGTTITKQVFWAVAVLGYFFANIRLYVQQEKIIAEYKKNEADLVITSQKVGSCNFSYMIGSTSENANGFPDDLHLFASFEIENIGKKEGILISKIDVKKSKLPDFLNFTEAEPKGNFFASKNIGNATTPAIIHIEGSVPGETRANLRWQIPIRIVGLTPEEFANQIKNSDEYQLLINYRTKRIGGFGNWHEVILTGNFNELKKELLVFWKARYPHLYEILK